MEPTTQLVLDRTHPGDRARVKELLERIRYTGAPFSRCYRIIGGDGVERRAVLVGEGAMCELGEVTTIEGSTLTEPRTSPKSTCEEYAQAVLDASAESRAFIEQAKGVLMLAYGLDSGQAFAMLRWWSRNRNVKVRDLAPPTWWSWHAKERSATRT